MPFRFWQAGSVAGSAKEIEPGLKACIERMAAPIPLTVANRVRKLTTTKDHLLPPWNQFHVREPQHCAFTRCRILNRRARVHRVSTTRRRRRFSKFGERWATSNNISAPTFRKQVQCWLARDLLGTELRICLWRRQNHYVRCTWSPVGTRGRARRGYF